MPELDARPVLDHTLFTEQGTAAVPDHPALRGGRCTACGYLFFPMQQHGCERCGSTALEPHMLSGRGHVLAFARVYRHPDPSRPAPFAVVSVMTDDGVALNAVADPGTEQWLATGTRVVTTLGPETREGHGRYDLRFAVEPRVAPVAKNATGGK